VIEMPEDDWEKVFAVNVKAIFLLSKHVIPHMIAAKRGSIINVSSNSARRGIPRRSDYGASKAGLFLLTQSLAEELGPHGIRVNCIVPGHIWGDNVREFYELRGEMLGKTFDEVYAMYADQTSLKRIPLPEEIAYSVLFFACEWSSAITGQSLDVNAGLIFH